MFIGLEIYKKLENKIICICFDLKEYIYKIFPLKIQIEKKFNLKYVSSKSDEKVKFHKERGIHSVQLSSETAEDLNQDDILQFNANLSNNPHDL